MARLGHPVECVSRIRLRVGVRGKDRDSRGRAHLAETGEGCVELQQQRVRQRERTRVRRAQGYVVAWCKEASVALPVHRGQDTEDDAVCAVEKLHSRRVLDLGVSLEYRTKKSPPPRSETYLADNPRVVLPRRNVRHQRQTAVIEIHMRVRRQPEHIRDAIGRLVLSQRHDANTPRQFHALEHADQRPELVCFFAARRERDDVAAAAEVDSGDDAGAVVAGCACGFDGVGAGGGGGRRRRRGGGVARVGGGARVRHEGTHAVGDGAYEGEDLGGGGVGGGDGGEQWVGFTGKDEELGSFHSRIEEPALVVGQDGVGDVVSQPSERVLVYHGDWIVRGDWFIRRD